MSKKKFNSGDKFILEIGEKRMALDEYEIVGTDLWVWGSLLEKLTPYELDHSADVSKKVDADLISRRGAIEALVDWEMTYDWDDHCREEDPKPAYIVSPSDVIEHLQPAQLDNRLSKIAELVEGTIDNFDLDDAMDLLYQIKEIVGNETSNIRG